MAAPSVSAGLLRWREKTIRATTSTGCAEMRKTHKIGCSIHFGETGESPDSFNFYCQHNINSSKCERKSILATEVTEKHGRNQNIKRRIFLINFS